MPPGDVSTALAAGPAAIIAIRDLTFSFASGDQRLQVIDIPAWSLATGATAVIEGPSGCGKSTLLNLLGGLVAPDAGQVSVCGTELTRLDEAGRDRWRARHVGIIFQGLNLLSGFDACENVLLGSAFGVPAATTAAAGELLREVGLGHRLHHRPGQLSLGEQQRVAIARALIKRPELILADEPTGSLDPRHAQEVAEMLRRICHEHRCTLVMVCHQPEIAAGFPVRIPFAQLNRSLPVPP